VVHSSVIRTVGRQGKGLRERLEIESEFRVEVSMVIRRPWEKPTLVVLGRGNPQEAVLRGCKVRCDPPMKHGATIMNFYDCMESPDCVQCDSVAYS